MGRKSGASLLHAVRSADALGRPLNILVTIHMGQLGSSVDTVFHDFAELREWFRRWSGNTPKRHPRNGTPPYAYVHENENGLPHTHWMVHVHPLNWARFEAELTRWLMKFFNIKKLPAGAVQVKEAYNPEGLKLYMAKNLDPYFAELWNIEWEEGGPIAFRRADVSRNLGPKFWKRQKAAYKAARAAERSPSVPATVAALVALPKPPMPSHVGSVPTLRVPAELAGAAVAALQLPHEQSPGRCS